MQVTTRVKAYIVEDHALRILDQRLLPHEQRWLTLRDASQVAEAIRTLAVRGAPLIGAAAAYGLWLGARQAVKQAGAFPELLKRAHDELAASRPTAVNLFFALARGMRDLPPGPEEAVAHLRRNADQVVAEDVAACQRMAQLGAELMPQEGGVLTHCNAGALATCGVGTALGVIRGALALGKKLTVYADETRPVWQGARLTAWELMEDGIDVVLLPDSAAAHLMRQGRVHAAVVGADRVALNGDVANKVGTYSVALACQAHRIPLWVAAPSSTLDAATATGSDIRIEQRDRAEVTGALEGRERTPAGVGVYNPAFDVTPADLVAGIITERGVARPARSWSGLG